MAERITFNVSNNDGVVRMSLCGELDVYTLPKIKRAVDILLAGHILGIVLDLTALEFIDSSGIGMLVGYYRSMRNADKAITIGAPRGEVDRLFRTTHLRNVLPIYDELEDAEAALRCCITPTQKKGKTRTLPLAELAPIEPPADSPSSAPDAGKSTPDKGPKKGSSPADP